jgi:hypothetical protein
VDDETIHIHIGLIWEIDIPRRDIAAIRPYTLTDRPELKAVFLNAPKLLIELARPLQAEGFYGNTRTVTKLAFSVDSSDEFVAAVGDSPPNV